jgi:hypothetical protein
MAFWNRTPDPGLAEEVTGRTRHPYTPKSEGGILGWGLTYDQIKKGRPEDFARRAGYFAMPFNAAMREDFANSVGLLSKSQKQAVKGAGMFTRAMHAAIPISTLVGVGAYALDGNTTGFISDIAAPGIGMFSGYRLGNSIGMTMASTITKSGGKRLGAALAAGAIGGATGGLLAYAAAETLVTAGAALSEPAKYLVASLI